MLRSRYRVDVDRLYELVGKTLQESQIRQRTGVKVIAVVRAEIALRWLPIPTWCCMRAMLVVGALEQLQAPEYMLYG